MFHGVLRTPYLTIELLDSDLASLGYSNLCGGGSYSFEIRDTVYQSSSLDLYCGRNFLQFHRPPKFVFLFQNNETARAYFMFHFPNAYRTPFSSWLIFAAKSIYRDCEDLRTVFPPVCSHRKPLGFKGSQLRDLLC